MARRKSRSKSRSKARKHTEWGAVSAHKRRTNPVRSHKRRKTHRRRNPKFSLKSLGSKAFLVNALLTAGGFVVGIKGTKYILMIPGVASMNRFVGVIHLLLGGIVAAKVKNPKVKALGAGIAAAGAYDLIAKNVTALALPTLLGMDADMGTEYGETYIPGQTEILGETYIPGRTEILSGMEMAGELEGGASDFYYDN